MYLSSCLMREIHLNFNSDMTVKVNTNNVLLSCQKKAGTGCHHSEWQWQDKVTPSSFLMRDVHLNLLFKGPLRSLQIMFTDAPVNDRSNWRSRYANDVGCKHWTVKHIVQRTCFVSFVCDETENVSPKYFQMKGADLYPSWGEKTVFVPPAGGSGMSSIQK